MNRVEVGFSMLFFGLCVWGYLLFTSTHDGVASVMGGLLVGGGTAQLIIWARERWVA